MSIANLETCATDAQDDPPAGGELSELRRGLPGEAKKYT